MIKDFSFIEGGKVLTYDYKGDSLMPELFYLSQGKQLNLLVSNYYSQCLKPLMQKMLDKNGYQIEAIEIGGHKINLPFDFGFQAIELISLAFERKEEFLNPIRTATNVDIRYFGMLDDQATLSFVYFAFFDSLNGLEPYLYIVNLDKNGRRQNRKGLNKLVRGKFQYDNVISYDEKTDETLIWTFEMPQSSGVRLEVGKLYFMQLLEKSRDNKYDKPFNLIAGKNNIHFSKLKNLTIGNEVAFIIDNDVNGGIMILLSKSRYDEIRWQIAPIDKQDIEFCFGGEGDLYV